MDSIICLPLGKEEKPKEWNADSDEECFDSEDEEDEDKDQYFTNWKVMMLFKKYGDEHWKKNKNKN